MTNETPLLRQIHPDWFQQGRLTSQAFRPFPKDKNRLSVYDGDLITSENSWTHFTVELQYVSIGVMAVTVEECLLHGLPALPDPKPFPSHAIIDFTGLGRNQVEKKAKRLRDAAVKRDWLFRAEDAA